uniref:Uncharacterized protein n=1 Tax=Arundo donax TaxID=35708 RepID=A0A0A9B7M9_ARUDO
MKRKPSIKLYPAGISSAAIQSEHIVRKERRCPLP